MDDRVAAAQRVQRRPLGLRVLPFGRGDAEARLRPARVARERGDLVAALAQLANDFRSDCSGGSGEGDPHQVRTARSTVGCSGSAAVSLLRSATSATALATARLTSRLKTLGMM